VRGEREREFGHAGASSTGPQCGASGQRRDRASARTIARRRNACGASNVRKHISGGDAGGWHTQPQRHLRLRWLLRRRRSHARLAIAAWRGHVQHITQRGAA
jgi:hypothetical protein